MFTGKATLWKWSTDTLERLKEIGIEVCGCTGADGYSKCLFVLRGSAHCLFGEECGIHKMEIESGQSKSVDCGDNEDLFLAIAALQDDTDENQWFYFPPENKWFRCHEDDLQRIRKEMMDSSQSFWSRRIHKATVPELIEHFKTK